MSDDVITKVHSVENGAWGEVILNRPERKNAIVGPLGEGLAEGIETLDCNESVKAIVLSGAGGAFCSGLDLKAFNADPAPEWKAQFQHIWRGAHKALLECNTPIIGAMERYAINGGAALAFACDILVVGQESFLQVGEVQIGMGAPYNLAWLSLRYSEAQYAQLALIGDRVKGPELLNLGFAQYCVEDEDVLSHAQGLAAKIGNFQGDGPIRIKSSLRAHRAESADEWFDQFTQATGENPAPKSMRD